MVIKIKNELEMKRWFEKNFEKLGYSKIIRKDRGDFPDFIMLRNNKETKVELETLSSNFILHNHDLTKVDEVVCMKKDINLNLPVIEIKGLKFLGGKRRISATVDNETVNIIEVLLKDGTYRNKSHVIETAIENLAERLR
jgi:hypothetical protein